ncbi:hypothetical protein K402DRAFT_70147 [Aulographum hederae CBS 113979]|uniref:Uncharacterized protein n=1 Tax=Aulographum hederae CBS 113979 TaxID=1176131 RepID=A0A6G1HFI6_9PEZI|nr:hypothetical protein K402DRAFT_70147 [Aulographum hederae CBS 113979]
MPSRCPRESGALATSLRLVIRAFLVAARSRAHAFLPFFLWPHLNLDLLPTTCPLPPPSTFKLITLSFVPHVTHRLHPSSRASQPRVHATDWVISETLGLFGEALRPTL